MTRDRARPERSRGETHDETIDRVAARLTMVPADPALAARIAAGLDTHERFVWPRVATVGAAVAVVAVFAVVLFNDAGESPGEMTGVAPGPTTPVAAPAVAAPRVEVPSTVASAVSSTAAPRGRRARSAATDPAPLPEIYQIEALASPAGLAVGDLPTNTLTIEPVALAPLDLANLAIAELGERNDPKE
jgi:hypothetical protein